MNSAVLNQKCADKFTVSKREAFDIVGMPRVVQRWLHATRHATREDEKWLTIVAEGGRGKKTRIDYESLRRAYQRYVSGERPPLLPSERKEDANGHH
jgi:hypothetical protein